MGKNYRVIIENRMVGSVSIKKNGYITAAEAHMIQMLMLMATFYKKTCQFIQ